MRSAVRSWSGRRKVMFLTRTPADAGLIYGLGLMDCLPVPDFLPVVVLQGRITWLKVGSRLCVENDSLIFLDIDIAFIPMLNDMFAVDLNTLDLVQSCVVYCANQTTCERQIYGMTCRQIMQISYEYGINITRSCTTLCVRIEAKWNPEFRCGSSCFQSRLQWAAHSVISKWA